MFNFAHPDTLPDISMLEPIEGTEPSPDGNYWMGYYAFEETETAIGLTRCMVSINVN
jgi:hypothetical protein